MKFIPHNLILLLAIIYATDLRAGCNSPNANMVTVEITKPTGDPTTTAGANADNERTYSSGASNPTVTVVCTAKDVPQEDEDYLRWTIEDVGSIKAKWNPHVAGDEYTGKGESATATYTGLPSNYDDFGKKKITLILNGGVSAADCKDETYVEIFFPRDASNHPGNTSDPNWFYYWGQVYTNANVKYDASYSGSAKTSGMKDWSYTSAQSKTEIVIGNSHPGKFKSYGVGEEFSGIDRYVGTVIHEEKHVDQITRTDNTMPASNGNDSFRYGWAWNQGTSHNHYKQGVDKKWGVAGNDDDNNGTVDDAAVQPPFEPGNGDDEDLSHPSWSTWIKGLAFPSPMLVSSPNESEAINASDSAVDENDYAGSDWGDPGKQHETLNKYDD